MALFKGHGSLVCNLMRKLFPDFTLKLDPIANCINYQEPPGGFIFHPRPKPSWRRLEDTLWNPGKQRETFRNVCKSNKNRNSIRPKRKQKHVHDAKPSISPNKLLTFFWRKLGKSRDYFQFTSNWTTFRVNVCQWVCPKWK